MKEETALQFFKEAIEIFEMNEAKSNYSEYASVYQAVGTIYAKRDEIDNAIYYTKQKIHLAERCEDPMDFSNTLKKDMADGYHNMGLFFAYKNLHGESADFYRKSFEIKKAIKADRTGIYLTLRNLAAALNVMVEYEEAVQIYKDCLKYTDDVIERVSTYNKIGVILCKMNRSENAMEYYSKALQEESALNGNFILINDPKKRKIDQENRQNLHLALLNNAANCVTTTSEDIDTALGYYEKARDLRSSDSNVKSTSTSSTFEVGSVGITYNMGLMYMKNQDFESAANCFLEYLEAKGYNSNASIKKNTKDEKERKSMEEIAAVLNNIGNVKYNQGLYEESVDFLSKSLAMKESIYGSRSSKLALTASNLGTSYYHLQDYDSALKNLELAVTLLSNNIDFSRNDQNLETSNTNRMASLHNKIGNIYVKIKEFNLAITQYQKAYKLRKELWQDQQDHHEVLLVKHNIALMHVKTGNLEEALVELESILDGKVAVLGPNHLSVVKLTLDIAGVLCLTKQFREARKLCESSISKFRSAHIPENHSYILQAQQILNKIDEGQQWNLNLF